MVPIFSEKCNTISSSCSIYIFFYLFIFSPFDKFRLLFVSSFLAHSSSKGNLQQLEFRESKETQ